MTVLEDVAVVDETPAADVVEPAQKWARLRRTGLVVFDTAVVVVFWLVATNSTSPLAGLLHVPEAAVAVVVGIALGAAAMVGAAWVHRAVRGEVADDTWEGTWDETGDEAADNASWGDAWDADVVDETMDELPDDEDRAPDADDEAVQEPDVVDLTAVEESDLVPAVVAGSAGSGRGNRGRKRRKGR